MQIIDVNSPILFGVALTLLNFMIIMPNISGLLILLRQWFPLMWWRKYAIYSTLTSTAEAKHF